MCTRFLHHEEGVSLLIDNKDSLIQARKKERKSLELSQYSNSSDYMDNRFLSNEPTRIRSLNKYSSRIML